MNGELPQVLRFLSLVTRDAESPSEAIERIRSSQESADLGALGEPPTPTVLDDAYRAVQDAERGRTLGSAQLASIEALIDSELRPAIDIVDGAFSVKHPRWKHLSEDVETRKRIESVAASVGRIELPGNPKYPYGGTGFVVRKNLLMTNRHVAELFSVGVGTRKLAFLPGAAAGIDFLRERDRPTGPMLAVKRVVMIHPYWDMALLEVDDLPETHLPLRLSLDDARDFDGRQIFIVGYPAFDYRNPTEEQDWLFDKRYGVKRLQPGELHGGVKTGSYGKLVRAAGHDCSTLGGNSGSAVFDLATGEVLALHFGGAYHQINYAVPCAALAADGRIVDSGVTFAGQPVVDLSANRTWWVRADDDEEPLDTLVSGRDASLSTMVGRVASVSARSDSTAPTVRVDIPLTVTVSISVTVPEAARASDRADTRDDEALREPWHDSDYSTRTGYNEAFLDEEQRILRVPMPSASQPEVLAATLDGRRILHYQNFSLAVHAKRKLALFTACNLTREPELRNPLAGIDYTRGGLSGLNRGDHEKWFLDPRLDARYQLPDIFFRKGRQAFDKGHVVRRQDVAWGRTFAELKRGNGDSYHATNCSPQVARFNRSNLGQDNWGALENLVFKSASSERLCVFGGPVLRESDETFVGVGDNDAVVRVKIPSAYWKVIVARDESGLSAYGFVLEQDLSDVEWEFVVDGRFMPFMVQISDIESVAGVRFAETVRSSDQFFLNHGTELEIAGISRRTFGSR